MNKDKKIGFLRKQLDKSNEKIKSIDSERKRLQSENDSLRAELDSTVREAQVLKDALSKYEDEHLKRVADLKALKKKYKDMNSEMLLLKAQYKKEMMKFINELYQPSKIFREVIYYGGKNKI